MTVGEKETAFKISFPDGWIFEIEMELQGRGAKTGSIPILLKGSDVTLEVGDLFISTAHCQKFAQRLRSKVQQLALMKIENGGVGRLYDSSK